MFLGPLPRPRVARGAHQQEDRDPPGPVDSGRQRGRSHGSARAGRLLPRPSHWPPAVVHRREHRRVRRRELRRGAVRRNTSPTRTVRCSPPATALESWATPCRFTPDRPIPTYSQRCRGPPNCPDLRRTRGGFGRGCPDARGGHRRRPDRGTGNLWPGVNQQNEMGPTVLSQARSTTGGTKTFRLGDTHENDYVMTRDDPSSIPRRSAPTTKAWPTGIFLR